MLLVENYRHCPDKAKGAVVALGNFDGVHYGHQKILKEAAHIAQLTQGSWGVLTFNPHPIDVLRPSDKPYHLTQLSQKQKYVEALGADLFITINFDEEFSKMAAEDFLQTVLIDSLSVSHIVIGYDFIFGHKRRGNAELLKQFARDEHFGVTQLSAVSDKAVIYSSTAVRKAVGNGDMPEAARLLGRPFTVFGTVIKGDQKGRTIGFPTANISLGSYIRPKYGVYAVEILYKEKRFAGVANMGIRPSVETKRELLEVFIFDFADDLYDQELQIEFISYIRPEQRFESLQDLQHQIEKDCQSAKQIMRLE